MKITLRILSAIAVLSLLAVLGQAAFAGEETPGRGRGPRAGGDDGPFAELRQARREHVETQQEENRELRERLQGEEPAAIVAALRQHCRSQYSENTAFAAKQYEKRVAILKEIFAEREVPAEKQEEALAALAGRRAKITSHRQTQHAENLALLEELAGEADLTHQALRTRLREHRQTQRRENRTFRREFCPRAGREGRGEGRGRDRGPDAEQE